MMSALLEAHGLQAFYGDAQALFGIDLSLAQGELVAIIGANGAGKSTLLKCLTGLVRTPPEAVRFKGEAIGGLPPGEIVKRGLAMVPEGRRLFPSLSVEENLLIGGLAGRKGPWNLQRLYGLFPILAEKRHNPGTELSGGHGITPAVYHPTANRVLYDWMFSQVQVPEPATVLLASCGAAAAAARRRPRASCAAV